MKLHTIAIFHSVNDLQLPLLPKALQQQLLGLEASANLKYPKPPGDTCERVPQTALHENKMQRKDSASTSHLLCTGINQQPCAGKDRGKQDADEIGNEPK